ncbi:LOW QUALITY PROTEIN: uncharacterized protein Bbg [Anoplolepis gracilipes]|uniref:LOW QUALITY PROTEIN: uncharacterized protein Bbg n=1 Tax=Anoplolepis gracilipes TaxID=354296 RepID=UPI003BA11A30
MDVAKGTTEDFVTVVSVGSQPTSENFVTVLSIGNGKKSDAGESSVSTKNNGAANGMDGHLEEEVEVFRLPGERLGFGLKFEGGNKTSERVRRLFVQSCAEQSPASRAKCSWGTLGEGDEVLSIDGIPVTHMTRLDCVRRLKESQLVIRLMVRCRGALRPEVVSAERKIERNKVPPELPAAPPPVPPRKLRQPRGPADGEANPSPVKKLWDSPQSPKSPASQTGSATKVSSYESCESSPRSVNGSSHQESTKESPKDRSPEFTKSKQEPPEAMVYLDARSQCGSTHGSTSDDTGSSMSTVMDRFSTMSDRVSTISTTSTASTTGSEQPSEFMGVDRDLERSSSDRDVLLSRAICPLEMLERDFSNPPDYLLRRLASSEAVTHVESRGEVERITAVVAPNTVLIEETITLQPPLSFQDAPLSYGHEARPDLFYTADLAADSTTHFRPIKDDVELVERVNGSVHEEVRISGTERSNGGGVRSSPPPLPARNHVNRICVNQTSESGNDARLSGTMPVSPEREPSEAPLLPPKPLPRKDVKARRKRPPPPPPPPIIAPRREIKSSPIESSHLTKEKEDISQVESAKCVQPGSCDSLNRSNVFQEFSTGGFENTNGNGDRELGAKNLCHFDDEKDNTANTREDTQTNKVFEIIEIRMAKGLQLDQKEEVVRNEPNSTLEAINCEQNEIKDKVTGRNKQDQSQSTNNSNGILTEQNSNFEPTDKHVDESNNEETKHLASESLYREGTRTTNDSGESTFKEAFSLHAEDTLSVDNSTLRESEDDETYQSLDEINDDMKNPDVNRMLEDEEVVEDGDTTDESDDGDDYYWQSNLATIGEEEETSLEYVNANTDVNDFSELAAEESEESSPAIEKDAFVKNARDDEADRVSEIAEFTEEDSKKSSKNTVNGKMENCGGGQRLPPDGDEFPAAYQEFSNNQPPYSRYIAVTRTTATIATNGGLCNENETFRASETFKMLANDSNVVGSRSIILSDSKMTSPENVRQDINKIALTNMDVRPEIGAKATSTNADNVKSSEVSNEERKLSHHSLEDIVKKNASTATSPLYSCQTSNGNSTISEKKMEITGYYHKDAMTIEEVPSHVEKDTPVDTPPPLPLTGPPKLEQMALHARNVSTIESPQRKFSLNGDLWRQDDKSERSVRDKIAMFSSQSNLDAPLFPNVIAATAVTSNGKRLGKLSKYKSSEDVCCDDKSNAQKDRSTFLVDRTQSSFDLTDSARPLTGHDSAKKYSQKTPSLSAQPTLLLSPVTQTTRVPKTLPVVPPKVTSLSSPLSSSYDKQNFLNTTTKNYCTESSSLSNSAYPSIGKTVGSYNNANNSVKTTSTPLLTRATSFSGSTLFVQDRSSLTADPTGNSQISRTNSLASTFRRPGDDARRSSLNQLIEQRRKSISKLRGLVIPEKDTVSIDQPIVDLPEIKSRDSILLHQIPKANIQDKWGSQSSLASNASTASQPLKATTSFKMPAPQIHSKYSPAFKRKSLTVYGTSVTTNSSSINGNSPMKSSASSTSTFSEPPKSLESICSPTRSDYSFEFASTTSSPDGSRNRPRMMQRKARLDYDDSDNDSAVSSSQSSISRGFSPPMSPAPSERSTISSERSYISTEMNYQRRPLIADSLNRTSVSRDVRDSIGESDKDQFGSRIGLLGERTCLTERSSSSSSGGSNSRSPQPNELFSRNSQIPQRQLRRSNSTDTNCSTSSTLTSGSQASAESLSRRVLKPQSVEAINRKNILASARCRSGRDLNGSPLIQRKFSDDEDIAIENGSAVRPVINDSGNDSVNKQEIKIAYIEVTDSFAKDEGSFQKKAEELKLPPKRSMLPPPSVRPPKPEMLEPSNDLKMWVRAEAKTLARAMEEKSNNKYDKSPPVSAQTLETSSVIHTARKNHGPIFDEPVNSTINGGLSSKNRMTINEAKITTETSKTQSRASVSPKRSTEDQNDLLTILTTKSRSRSAIHVDEGTFGRSKSQMSLEEILAAKADSKLLRTQSTEPKIEKNGTTTTNLPMKSTWDSKEGRYCRRGSTTSNESWSEDRPFVSKIPTLGKAKNIDSGDEMSQSVERIKSATASKIPTSRGLNRRSASVTDMKRALDASPVHSQSQCPGGTHNRFPSLDSSVDESIGTETDVDRCYGEQFGSISSLASSTSLISQQELAQLVEEASLEEARGAHDVIVVLLHKENPTGSVGITLAGGADCEVKEITVHRVLTHSIADKDGRVQRGDRILSINGRSTRGLTHRESMAVLKQPRSEVVLVVSRARIEEGCKLRSRTASVETIVEGLETNGNVEDTAWGPPSTVAVYKDGAGLGFSLEGGRDSPLGDRPLIIKKIFTGGAAEKTGALKAGDQLLEVNGNDVTRMSRIEVWSLMKKLHDGEVNLLVRHPATKSS